VPAHPIARALLAEAGIPLAAPSANLSGTLSPTTAAHVARSLDGRIDAILDGGACPVGIESTVIDVSVSPFAMLRPGGLSREEIETVARPIVAADGAASGGTDGARSPGMQSRHYAPRRPLRLGVTRAEPNETVLGFGPTAPKGALNLSPTGKTVEAAANLFAMLHKLDQSGDGPIAVMPIPNIGIGAAINDRLRRAARADSDAAGDKPN
jgi:L-threonylcarbamoyladenylate synthase